MYHVIVKSLRDQYHCYILTGKIEVVNDSNLCKIFSKRSENKEPQNVGFKPAREDERFTRYLLIFTRYPLRVTF